MSYHVYGAEDFKTLFKAIDSHLTRPVEIILIGGSAALLAYKATRLTQDIDSFNNINALQSAYEKQRQTPVLIFRCPKPVSPTFLTISRSDSFPTQN